MPPGICYIVQIWNLVILTFVMQLWMAVGDRMVHGDKPKSHSYKHLAMKYGIVRQYVADTYYQKPYTGG